MLNRTLTDSLKAAINHFADTSGEGFKTYIDSHSSQIFGVHKSTLTFDETRKNRAKILQFMGLPENTPCIQVVGDSAAFGATTDLGKELDPLNRAAYACQWLINLLNCFPNHVILYGLTGKKDDVNGIINQWLTDNPPHLRRVIGNAVSSHTIKAIEEWGCSSADLKYVTVVYPDALFGDDVNFTDQFVPQYDDRAGQSLGICLEGGIQSFLQVINMLKLNVPIYALEKLRGPANESTKLDGRYTSFFSAAEFLGLIHTAYKQAKNENRTLTHTDIETIRQDYLQHHVFANPTRRDYATKEALFREAMNEFFAHELWNKMDLLTIFNCETELNKRAVVNNKIITPLTTVASQSGSPLYQQPQDATFTNNHDTKTALQNRVPGREN